MVRTKSDPCPVQTGSYFVENNGKGIKIGSLGL